MKNRIFAVLILLVAFCVAFFVIYSGNQKIDGFPEYKSPTWFSKFPFRLGLDLSGGTHLVYRADVSKLEKDSINESLGALRDVIERRINMFGVSEPVVQIEEGSITDTDKYRLIVDLPGVTNIDEAIKIIGETPLLEFKTERKNFTANPEKKDESGNVVLKVEDMFENTKLTGQFLKSARVEFSQTTGVPMIMLNFNKEGADIFSEITKNNIGKTVAIFLDGQIISSPKVNEEISGGEAVITGDFNIKEAKELVGRLNSGALPVPIEIISTQTIGPILGEKALDAGIKAALIGFLALVSFLIIWYRLPGLIAVISLSIYVAIVLTIFKLLPVTLTTAGIAGFIISLGIAVDANVLIFERLKEEMKGGRTIFDSINAGFSKAWSSIRDANISSLLTAVILFWFGSSLIKGFALTFGIGILASLLTAIMITRIFLRSIRPNTDSKASKFLFSSGFR